MTTRLEFVDLLEKRGVTDRKEIASLMSQRRQKLGQFDDEAMETEFPEGPKKLPEPAPEPVVSETPQQPEPQKKESALSKLPGAALKTGIGAAFGPAAQGVFSGVKKIKGTVDFLRDPLPALKEKVEGFDEYDSSIIQSWRRGQTRKAFDYAAAKSMASGGKNIQEILKLEDEFKQKVAKDPKKAAGVINQLVEMLPAMAEGVAAQAAGAAAKSPLLGKVASTAMFSSQDAGEMYKDLIRAGVSHEKAAMISAPAGVMSGSVETLQASIAGGAKAKKMVKEAGDAAIKVGVKKASAKLAAKYGKNVGANVAEELEQNAIKFAAMELGKRLEGIPGVDGKQLAKAFWDSTVETFTQSIGPVALLGIPSAVAGGAKIYKEAKQLSETKSKLDAIARLGPQETGSKTQIEIPLDKKPEIKKAEQKKGKPKKLKITKPEDDGLTIQEKQKQEWKNKFKSEMLGEPLTRANVQEFINKTEGKKISREDAAWLIRENVGGKPYVADFNKEIKEAKQPVGLEKEAQEQQEMGIEGREPTTSVLEDLEESEAPFQSDKASELAKTAEQNEPKERTTISPEGEKTVVLKEEIKEETKDTTEKPKEPKTVTKTVEVKEKPTEQKPVVEEKPDKKTEKEPEKLTDQPTPPKKTTTLKFTETAKKAGLPQATKTEGETQSNIETAKKADEIIKQKGIRGAASWLSKEEKPSAEHTAVAGKVAGELQKRAIANMESNPDKAGADMEQAVSIINNTAVRLRKMGQEIQAAAMMSKLDPDAVVFTVQRRLEAKNKDLPPSKRRELKPPEIKKLRELSTKTQEWEGLSEGAKNASKAVSDVLAKNPKDVTPNDIQAIKDYRAELNRMLKQFPGDKDKSPAKPKPKPLLKVVEETLNTQADKAMARYMARQKGQRLQAGLPLDDMADMAVYGAMKLSAKGVKYAAWSADMVKAFGENVKPHLKKIYNESQKVFNAEKSRINRLRVEEKKIGELQEKYEKGTADIKIDPNTYKKAMEKINKLTGEAKTEAVLELQQAMEATEKPSFLRKVATAQTIGQLLNLKTIGRNVLGNEMFYRVERLNKLIATPIDIGMSVLTGKRSVSFAKAGQSGFWEGFTRGASLAWRGLSPADIETQFDLKAPAFQSKKNPLFWAERALGVTLRGFDYAGYNRARNQAIGEIAVITAKNKGLKGDKAKKFVQDFVKDTPAHAAEIAHLYGKFATFQDTNIFSKSATELKKLMNLKKEFGLGDLVLKYPKTPANLIARALDYSPVGVTRSFYQIGRAIGRYGFDQAEFVNGISRATVGLAGFTAVGYMLLNSGVLTGSSENWREEEFKKQTTGEGPYKVNVSALVRWVGAGFKPSALKVKKDDYLVSYDWAQPLAVSLALGANIARQKQESAGSLLSANGIFDSILDAFAGGIQTIAEQPLLSGLQELLGGGFSNLTKGEQWLNALKKTAASAPSSFIPTLVNQVRQFTDNTARETHDPNVFKKAMNRVVNRIPWWQKTLPEQYKLLGIDKKTAFHEGQNTLWNVFINPAFVSKYKVDPMVEIILNPLRTADLTGQLPKRAPTRLSVSPKQIEKLASQAVSAKIKGKTLKEREQIINEFLGKKGVDKKDKSYKIEITGRERSDMQKFLASRTDKIFRAITKGQKLDNLDAESQERILGKYANLVGKYARENLIRKKLGLKPVAFMEK